MSDIIKLAKAMRLEIYSRGADTYPLRKLHNNLMQPFSPFTDANDCEALIQWLREHKYITVTVTFGKGVRFDHDIGTHEELEIYDWKQGVCELALAIIPPEDSRDD